MGLGRRAIAGVSLLLCASIAESNFEGLAYAICAPCAVFAGSSSRSASQSRARDTGIWMNLKTPQAPAPTGRPSEDGVRTSLKRASGSVELSRASFLRAASLSVAGLAWKRKAAGAAATSRRGLRRALVNVIRLEAGLQLLRELLAARQIDGLQTAIKILNRDTDPRGSMGAAAIALEDLGLPQRQQAAEQARTRALPSRTCLNMNPDVRSSPVPCCAAPQITELQLHPVRSSPSALRTSSRRLSSGTDGTR
jgi:hypothetical protein